MFDLHFLDRQDIKPFPPVFQWHDERDAAWPVVAALSLAKLILPIPKIGIIKDITGIVGITHESVPCRYRPTFPDAYLGPLFSRYERCVDSDG